MNAVILISKKREAFHTFQMREKSKMRSIFSRTLWQKKIEKSRSSVSNLHKTRTPLFLMKITLKKCFAAAFFAVMSLSTALFAQSVAEYENVPFIDIKNVKHTVVQVPGYTGNWGCTTIELQAKTCAWAPKFKQNDWVNNLKVTLTLAYPKTQTSIAGVKARGNKEEKAASLAEAEESAGTDTEARYTYYRAAVTLTGLQIGAGRASVVSFFIPPEILERESKLSNAMSGQAKPDFYLVQFSYKGSPLPECNPKGELLAKKALDFPIGKRPTNMKSPADFISWLDGNASGSVGDTKGLLVPYPLLPWQVWPKNAPSVIFENIEQ